ncbi:hypothetical protein UlMin_004650 [Ulmus minor]
MESPHRVKEVQSLTGRVTTLNRFILRATDKCQPFFRALCKGKDFSWTAECEQSFQELKTYLGRPPLLSKPQEGKSLILYLAVSKGAVSSALIREEEGFENEKLRSICRNLGITKIFSSRAHPKSNGQVKAVNKTIKYTLKKKLEKSKGAWVDELPLVLWSYRTSFRTTTGETPFSLAYGINAVVPVELGIPTFRIKNFNEEDNDVLLALALDLLEEKREKAQLRATAL